MSLAPVALFPDSAKAGFKKRLADFIADFPYEDLTVEFQRGMLAGLIEAYELADFDRGDARYIAGCRLLTKMKALARKRPAT